MKALDVLQDAPRDWRHLYETSSDEMGPPGAPNPSTRVVAGSLGKPRASNSTKSPHFGF